MRAVSTRFGQPAKSARSVETRTRVRYKETDQMGIVHHSNYFVWFEIGRTELCLEAGIAYRDIEAAGFVLVVTEAACRYRRPFQYDDEVVIRTSITEGGSRSLRFAYELRKVGSEEIHATGFTHHFWVDAGTRRPVVAPESILKAFRPFFTADGTEAS